MALPTPDATKRGRAESLSAVVLPEVVFDASDVNEKPLGMGLGVVQVASILSVQEFDAQDERATSITAINPHSKEIILPVTVPQELTQEKAPD